MMESPVWVTSNCIKAEGSKVVQSMSRGAIVAKATMAVLRSALLQGLFG